MPRNRLNLIYLRANPPCPVSQRAVLKGGKKKAELFYLSLDVECLKSYFVCSVINSKIGIFPNETKRNLVAI